MPWGEGGQRESVTLLLWLLRALRVIRCLFFAVLPLRLAVHKPSVPEGFAGVGGLG